MKSLGVDLSSNKTGIVLLESNGTPKPTLLIETLVQYPEVEGFDRYIKIVTRIMEIIEQHKPDVIVIEGYSLNLKNASSVIPLVELGGLLRFCLKLDGIRWLDPQAGKIKKFILGKGQGAKNLILLGVYKRFGVECKDDNTADAYCASAMGLAHSNQLPGITLEMRKVVAELSWKCN